MGREIERKFLVTGDSWRADSPAGVRMVQGYVAIDDPVAVRVRIAGDQASLNIKCVKDSLVDRYEFEYAISLDQARKIVALVCRDRVVEKTRYEVEHAGMTWEIDEFEGENAGLVLGEIELNRVDQQFAIPDWAGDEVSHDPRYLNTHLSLHPYSRW